MCPQYHYHTRYKFRILNVIEYLTHIQTSLRISQNVFVLMVCSSQNLKKGTYCSYVVITFNHLCLNILLMFNIHIGK